MKQQFANTPTIMFCGIVAVIAIFGWLLTYWCEDLCPTKCVVTTGGSNEIQREPERPNGAMRSAIQHVLFRGIASRDQLPVFLLNEDEQTRTRSVSLAPHPVAADKITIDSRIILSPDH